MTAADKKVHKDAVCPYQILIAKEVFRLFSSCKYIQKKKEDPSAKCIKLVQEIQVAWIALLKRFYLRSLSKIVSTLFISFSIKMLKEGFPSS